MLLKDCNKYEGTTRKVKKTNEGKTKKHVWAGTEVD